MIRVQAEPILVGAELDRFGASGTAGGIASFVGRVRGTEGVAALTLEHYPGMTERRMAEIEADARGRWELEDVLLVHRVGRMVPGDAIVLVATSSSHRPAALDACAFLIDWLKTDAPFWKSEETDTGERWVEARGEDGERRRRWL